MVTRRNGLLFNVRSVMKRFKLQKKIMPIIKFRLWKRLNTLHSLEGNGFLQGISHFKNNFNFCFFNNRKRKNQFTKMSQSFSLTNPSINWFAGIFRRLSFSINRGSSSKIGLNPFCKGFNCITNLQFNLIIVATFVVGSMFGNNQSTFSIDNTGEINNRIPGVISWDIDVFRHKIFPCLLTYNKLQPAETNREGTRKSEVIVRTLGKLSERGLTRPSASFNEVRNQYLVSNSNRTLINEDPVLNEATARLGQSLRETEDQLIREMLVSTASFVNCVGGVDGDNPTEIVRSDVDAVVATLQNNNADFISEMIEGENKFGTGPVRDAYFAMGHANLIGQLENVQGFINKAQYPSQMNTLTSEWGSIGNIRFLLSSRGSLTTNASLLGANVYNIFITGQEAYTVIDLNGATAKFIYHPVGWGDDACELRQTAGFRFAQVPRITNDAWIINLRATLA